MHIALITTDISLNMPIRLYQWVEQTFGPWQPTSVTKCYCMQAFQTTMDSHASTGFSLK